MTVFVYIVDEMSDSTDVVFSDANVRIFLASIVLVPWFEIRSKIFGTPGSISVLLEWLALVALTLLFAKLPLRAPARLRTIATAGASLFVTGSILEVSDSFLDFPDYWTGFGLQVALLSGILTLLVLLGGTTIRSFRRHSVDKRLRLLSSVEKAFAVTAFAWLMPSLLQPMDAWLNLGDSTEKVLDEVAGWTTGNFPGIHTSWVYSNLLGLPLAPLSLVEMSPIALVAGKIILVVLYVNVLVLSVPLLISGILRKCVRPLSWSAALVVAMLSVSVSGSGENTSLFQELSFLSRGFPPIALGYYCVARLGKSTSPGAWMGVGLGLMSSLVLLNNYEYGFGSAVSVLVTLTVSLSRHPEFARVMKKYFVGFTIGLGSVTGFGAILGGDWVGRRLGAWSEVLAGHAALHSSNLGLFPPALGVPTLCFALGVTASALGFRHLRNAKPESEHRSAAVGCLYFGGWTIGSAPYFLNGGSIGGFRTQFLIVQLAILAFVLFGIARRSETGGVRESIDCEVGRMRFSLAEIESVPTLLVCCLIAGSVLQAPNGLTEWRRIQIPNSRDLGNTVNEWSPERFDYIETGSVTALAEQFGGVESVGWWYVNGNGIQAVTGIENLLGTTGFETMRSQSMFKVGCEPILRSRKAFVISGADMEERLRSCGFDSVRARSEPSNEGLVVYEINR